MHARYLFALGAALLLLSCGSDEPVVGPGSDGRYAIYLAADNAPGDSGAQLENLTLLAPAFLSTPDITSYSWDEHHITYPDSVWERLRTWGSMLHRTFVVAVGDERVYWGRFIDYLDSSGSQNPVIPLLARHPDGRNTTPPSLRIERAYPEYSGPPEAPDLRDDPRIQRALAEAGLLVP